MGESGANDGFFPANVYGTLFKGIPLEGKVERGAQGIGPYMSFERCTGQPCVFIPLRTGARRSSEFAPVASGYPFYQGAFSVWGTFKEIAQLLVVPVREPGVLNDR